MKYIVIPIAKGITIMFAFITATLIFLAVMVWTFSASTAAHEWACFMDQVAAWDVHTCVAVWLVGIMYVLMCIRGIGLLCNIAI